VRRVLLKLGVEFIRSFPRIAKWNIKNMKADV